MIIPLGAKDIIDARFQGRKPADLVICSLVGKVQDKSIQLTNPTVYANAEAVGPYDWRWVVDLKICIFANPSTRWREIAMAIARNRPEWLGLWDVDALQGADVYALPLVEDICKPVSQWRWKLHFIPWMDFQNFGFAWGEQ